MHHRIHRMKWYNLTQEIIDLREQEFGPKLAVVEALMAYHDSSIIWHYLFKECDGLRIIRCKFVEGDVVSLLAVDVADSQYRLHQTPVPRSLIHVLLLNHGEQVLEYQIRNSLTNTNKRAHTCISYLSPIFLERLMSCSQVVARYSGGNMMRNVHVDIVAKNLYPV